MGCTGSTPQPRGADRPSVLDPTALSNHRARASPRAVLSPNSKPAATREDVLEQLQAVEHPFLDQYELRELLGSGCLGRVFRCTNKATGEDCAVKYAETEGPGAHSAVRAARAEERVMKRVRIPHPNLMSVIDVSHAGPFSLTVTELAEESLHTGPMCSGQCVYSEESVRAIVAGTVAGVAALHDVNLAHLDVKPDNIMLMRPCGASSIADPIDTTQVKLIDFGSSAHFTRGRSDIVRPTGTPYYAAPEVLKVMLDDKHRRRTRPYSEAADIWAIGILAYFLTTGNHPFVRSSKGGLDMLHACVEMGRVPQLPSSTHVDLADFITRCLIKDASSRPTADELLEHPYLRPPLAETWTECETVITPEPSLPRVSDASSFADNMVEDDDEPASTFAARLPSEPTSSYATAFESTV